MPNSPEQTRQEIDWQATLETALTAPGSIGNEYNRWQALGRQVLKGSKAYEILRPVTIKSKDQFNDDGTPKSFTRFKNVKCLFAYEQTEGKELEPVDIPEWDIDLAKSNLDVRERKFDLLDGNTAGYSVGREYAINPVAVHPAKTMFHEWGHIVLGHTTPAALAEYQKHRGMYEFGAEGTAHLVANELSIDTPESASSSRGYLQGWLRGEQPTDVSIRQVFTATDKILKAGRPAPAQAEVAA